MKKLHAPIFPLLLLFVIAPAMLVPPSAEARSPRGRHLRGTVVEVDAAARTFTFKAPGEPESRALRWNPRTRFVAGVTFAPKETVLQPGAAVEVIYISPFFGSDFVTKVVLVSATKPASGRRR